MDIDSDSKAEQAAWELAQAQEQVCTAQEAREKRQEEQKKGGGEEGKIMVPSSGCGVGGG